MYYSLRIAIAVLSLMILAGLVWALTEGPGVLVEVGLVCVDVEDAGERVSCDFSSGGSSVSHVSGLTIRGGLSSDRIPEAAEFVESAVGGRFMFDPYVGEIYVLIWRPVSEGDITSFIVESDPTQLNQLGAFTKSDVVVDLIGEEGAVWVSNQAISYSPVHNVFVVGDGALMLSMATAVPVPTALPLPPPMSVLRGGTGVDASDDVPDVSDLFEVGVEGSVTISAFSGFRYIFFWRPVSEGDITEIVLVEAFSAYSGYYGDRLDWFEVVPGTVEVDGVAGVAWKSRVNRNMVNTDSVWSIR